MRHNVLHEGLMRDVIVMSAISTIFIIFSIKQMLKYYFLKYHLTDKDSESDNEIDNDSDDLVVWTTVPDDELESDINVSSNDEPPVGLREILFTVLDRTPVSPTIPTITEEPDLTDIIRGCVSHYQKFSRVLYDIRKLPLLL